MPSLGCNVNEPLMVKADGACCLKALNTTAIPPNVLEKKANVAQIFLI